jgi:hypothetical protein
MKLAEIVAVAFYITVALFAVYYGSRALTKEPKLPCGVAEISPDFDSKHKEQCRQMRGHKL